MGPPAASAFAFDPATTFLGAPRVPAAAVAAYLSLVLVLPHVLPPRRVALYGLDTVHSCLLCLGSLAMLVGVCLAARERLGGPEGASAARHVRGLGGLDALAPYADLFCFPPGGGTEARGPLFFVSYLYYLSKLYELLDTLILILKRKPLTFLHVGHHAAVVFMSYLWLAERQSLQAIALATNAGIHVVMYGYYTATSIGGLAARLAAPCKVFITSGQIVQFVFSFVASVPFAVWTFARGGSAVEEGDRPLGFLLAPGLHLRRMLGGGAACAGFDAWLYNALFNAALLLLFVRFHRRTYRPGARAKRKVR